MRFFLFHTNTRIFIKCLISVFVILAFSFYQSSAQEAMDTLQSIALTDIASKSEETLNDIFRIKKDMENLQEVERINDKYPDFLKNLNQSKENFLNEKKRKISLSRIEEQERVWLILKTVINGWLPIVQKRSKLFDENLRLLENREKVWLITLSDAKKNKAPAALVERIRSLIQNIKKTKSEVKKVLNESLTLQSKLAEADLTIREMLNKISKLREKAGASLLTLDKPVIWKAFNKKEISSLFIETVIQGMHSRYAILHHYVSNFYHRFIYQFIFFIVLSFLFIALKRWQMKHPGADEASQAQKVLQWPVAMAFLFSLWLTPVFHQHAPFFIRELSFFLMLFPLLHILPRLLSGFYRKILYFFIFYFFLDKIGSVIIPGSLLQRLLSVAIGVMALALLANLMRYHRISGQVSDKVFVFLLQWASRLAFILLVISILANIIGAFSLAQFFVHGILFSGFLATILAVGVLAINQLWDIFLRLDIVLSYRSFSENTESIRARFNRIIYWLAIYGWIVQTLKAFNLYEGIKATVLSVIGYRLIVGSLSISLGDIIIFSITIYISVIISRFVRFVLEEDVLHKVKLPRGVAGSISMLTHYIILIIGFTFAMSAAGIEWSRFAIIAGALGVGIGFGLQDVVNNFVSGLILIFERPVKLGDIIELEDLKGNVKRIGIRSSTIRTFEGAEVIVPNSQLISNKLVNWTLSDRMRRVSVPVGVAYGTDPKKVIKLLENIAVKHPEVREKPEPMAIFMGFGESSLDFELRFWTNNFDEWLAIRTNISILINDELSKEGIEIPFPQRDIHLIGKQDKKVQAEVKVKKGESKQKK